MANSYEWLRECPAAGAESLYFSLMTEDTGITSEKTKFKLQEIEHEINNVRKQLDENLQSGKVSSADHSVYMKKLDIISEDNSDSIFVYDSTIRIGLTESEPELSEFFEALFYMIKMPMSDKNIIINEICCLNKYNIESIENGLKKIRDHLNETSNSLDDENPEVKDFIKELLESISTSDISENDLLRKIKARLQHKGYTF